MPYRFTTSPARTTLLLWPNQSLSNQGFAGFILVTAFLLSLPLLGLLGTRLLWGLLPFMAMAVGGLWYALRRSQRDLSFCEILTLTPERLHLARQQPGKPRLEWECNPYWAKLTIYPEGQKLSHYITLRGNGREVEIGAFLSADERKALYGDLHSHLKHLNPTP